jgi:hypothetical protein
LISLNKFLILGGRLLKTFINLKNSVTENKEITEMAIEEIKKKMKEDQGSHTGESEGEQL